MQDKDLDPAIFDETEQEQKTSLYALGGKRVFDLTLCVILIPILMPFLALIALVLWVSGGQPFYRQVRIGRDGEEFRMIKFRSMVPNAAEALSQLCKADPKIKAEWTRFQKLSNDPRITWLGNILRKTSADELPQIFNVLRGEMSFVGPRPFMVDQQDMYRAAGGRGYYDLRPGITGEWQVNGRSKTAFVDRVRFDNSYGETLSMTRDFQLLVKTAAVVIKATGK